MTARAAFVSFFDDLPMLDDAIIAHEPTELGWRGITMRGEIITVSGSDGHKAAEPQGNVLIMRGGKAVARRPVLEHKISIDDYLEQFNRGVELFKSNDCERALEALDGAIALAPTARAHFNRGLVLLTLGRWPEGFEGHERRLDLSMPPMCAEAVGLAPRWQGEDLRGKKLLLVHDAGFGDTIQQLRFVPQLLQMGASVFLRMPPELERLARQVAPLAYEGQEFDFWCPMLSLLWLLQIVPDDIPSEPYLRVDPTLVDKWRERLVANDQKIGVAWSVGRTVDGDYPRAIPLELLDQAIDCDSVISVQAQGHDEAFAVGVNAYPFEDFADCAALMVLLDQIVTVDTAAAHLAGAIGHPDVTVLLSHWSSWRWHQNAFYPRTRICRQATAGDWPSALAQI